MEDIFKWIKKNAASIAGILAIIIWSSNVGASKKVMNDLGIFRAAFLIYFFSGTLNFIILLAAFGKRKFVGFLKHLPVHYYLRTGIFFILNNVFLFLAIGLAVKPEEIIIVTLLNYTWPVLIFIFRVPIFHLKIRPLFFFGAITAAFTGITIAILQGYTYSEIKAIVSALHDNFLAFICALSGAVSWALYSNLLKKYKKNDDIIALPVIFIASSLVFFIILLFKGNFFAVFSPENFGNPYLIYVITGPTCLGYLLWFIAMKYGNRSLIVSLAFFIPLGSVYILSRIHVFPVTPMFWTATALITAAAFLGIRSVKI